MTFGGPKREFSVMKHRRGLAAVVGMNPGTGIGPGANCGKMAMGGFFALHLDNAYVLNDAWAVTIL